MHRLGCWTLSVALILVVLLPVLFYEVMRRSLVELGIAPEWAFVFFLATLAGGWIDIPLRRVPSGRIVRTDRLAVFGLAGALPHLTDLRRHSVIAINVGGAVIPGVMAAWQLIRLARMEEHAFGTMTALAICAGINVWVSWKLARPIPMVGIAVPGLVPGLVAAASAIFLAEDHAPTVAYVAGVLGPLLGGNILHLRDVGRVPIGLFSIGGAGAFDASVFSSVLAAFLA
jgi:uncharacterized membrane protein